MPILLKFLVETVDRTGAVGAAATFTPTFGRTESGEEIFVDDKPAGKILLEQLVPAAAAALEPGQIYAVRIEQFKPAAAEDTTPAQQ